MNEVFDEVGASAVQRVLLCDEYGPRPEGYSGDATSLPGHLIQLVLSGVTIHDVGGRRYKLEAGHLIWFHEDEWVHVEVEQGPWRFYTLNFIAPTLVPPAFDKRVRQVGTEVRDEFEELLHAWRDVQSPAGVRAMRVQGKLNVLLASLAGEGGEGYELDPQSALWWGLETWFRRDIGRRLAMDDLVAESGRSAATIARSCRAALGIPPMVRLKQVRMSLARGLVKYSDLRVGEVAARVGYVRVHEFSRDYRKHFGESPTVTREHLG